MKCVGMLSVLLLLGGCATTVTKPAKSLSSETSKLVFIRKCAEPTAWNLQIKIDGEQWASIANDSQVALNVPVGKHKYKIDWPFLAAQVPMDGEIEFAVNETTFLLYESHYNFQGVFAGVISLTKGARLHKLDAKQAEDLLSDLHGKVNWRCG